MGVEREPKGKEVVPSSDGGNKKQPVAKMAEGDSSKKLKITKCISQVEKGKESAESAGKRTWGPEVMGPQLARPVGGINVPGSGPSPGLTGELASVIAHVGVSPVSLSSQPTDASVVEIARGQIWKYPYPINEPNGCNVYLPYLKEMRGTSPSRPPELGHFAKEVLHAFEPTYVAHRMETNPVATTRIALGHLFEAGCVMGRALDDLEMRRGELIVSKDEAGDRRKAELERDHLQGQFNSLTKKYKEELHRRCRAEDDMKSRDLEIENLKRQLEIETQEVTEQAGLLEKSGEMVTQLSRELSTEKENAIRAEEVVRRLHMEKTEQAEAMLDEFLVSNAFKSAAMVSLTDMVKNFMYSQLRSLGRFYPFIPEQVGFTVVAGDPRPKALGGYKWDKENDKLVDLEGGYVPLVLSLKGCRPTPIFHIWKNVAEWPKNILIPNIPVSNVAEDSDSAETPMADYVDTTETPSSGDGSRSAEDHQTNPTEATETPSSENSSRNHEDHQTDSSRPLGDDSA